MTEERYTTRLNEIKRPIIYDNNSKKEYYNGKDIADLLNEKEKIISDLRKENYGYIDGMAFYTEENASLSEKISELEYENEQLKREKERYKRLSEIRDENINNRILSLKEFINNCEDEKVKNILEDFFYSEVNEYDLAKENRELKNENEQLKQDVLGQSEEIEILSDENEQLKEKIKALEDTNTGLIETIAHFDITEVL